jgi:coenzyme PQQ synthesis protein D (PqqD)
MGDAVVLVHLQTNRMYDLNRTAARLWELLGEGSSCARLHEQILREFDVDPADLEREIGSLLTSMVDQDLVQIREGDRTFP